MRPFGRRQDDDDDDYDDDDEVADKQQVRALFQLAIDLQQHPFVLFLWRLKHS